MKIRKLINNNTVIALDERDNEIILIGRGLGFGTKPGDLIDEGRVEKRFILSDSETKTRFQQLLLNTPLEYVTLAEEIIAYARFTLNKKLNENIYVTLVDHIHTSIERYKDQMKIKNVLLWEVKQFYKEEFAIGKHALQRIKEMFEIEMWEDEAAFIAIHFVTAQMDESIPTVFKITALMNDILKMVEGYFQMQLDENSIMYFRFTTHLKYFGQRLFNNVEYYDSDDVVLLEMIQKRYEKSFACAMFIKQYVLKNYQHTLTMDECLYLTIHIAKVSNEGKK